MTVTELSAITALTVEGSANPPTRIRVPVANSTSIAAGGSAPRFASGTRPLQKRRRFTRTIAKPPPPSKQLAYAVLGFPLRSSPPVWPFDKPRTNTDLAIRSPIR